MRPYDTAVHHDQYVLLQSHTDAAAGKTVVQMVLLSTYAEIYSRKLPELVLKAPCVCVCVHVVAAEPVSKSVIRCIKHFILQLKVHHFNISYRIVFSLSQITAH